MSSFIIITIIVLLALGVAAYMIFRKRKAAGQVTTQTLNPDYQTLLLQHVGYYQKLTEPDRQRFESLIADFITSVRIEGVGLEVSDLDRVLVAASAVIPIFGYQEWWYTNLTNVILYPDTFNNDFQFEGDSRNIMGMVGSGYMNGQMLLSRAALHKGFSSHSGKQNTGIHEFVHLLDKSDGVTDGVPEYLLAHEYAKPWLQMMHQEISRIEKGHSSDIDPYAATNEAEFLAVVAEYFFEKPEQLQQKHPELYAQLSRLFAQDPAAESGIK